LELDPTLTPALLEQVLKDTGQPVLDRGNGETNPLVNARRAADAVFASWCSRRADLEPCAFALECDGGLCPRDGQCFQGACVHAVPAAGTLPAAPGCSAASVGAVSLGLLVVLWVLRPRRRAAGGS